jgi:hypothetical protein
MAGDVVVILTVVGVVFWVTLIDAVAVQPNVLVPVTVYVPALVIVGPVATDQA